MMYIQQFLSLKTQLYGAFSVFKFNAQKDILPKEVLPLTTLNQPYWGTLTTPVKGAGELSLYPYLIPRIWLLIPCRNNHISRF